jgi:plastocyanin
MPRFTQVHDRRVTAAPRARILASAVLLASAALAVQGLPNAFAAGTGITINSGGCSGGGTLYCFNPETATSATGTAVTWTNQSGAPHTASVCDPTDCPGSPANTGSDTFSVSIGSANGSTGSFTFQSPGTYYYYCQIHGYAAMHGSITVSSVVQDSSTQVTYDGWHGVSDASANGGTYRVSSTKGETSTFKFTGTGVTWVTRKGPDQGIANVSIDGTSQGTVDLFASSAQSFSKAYSGLSSATHKIIVKVTGTKNASSTGKNVSVDAFTVGSTTTQDSASKVQYDSWAGASSKPASGGSLRSSAKAGAVASLGFSGASVTWVTSTGPSFGQAEVRIDGVSKGTFDLYSSTAQSQVPKSFSGLGAGAHVIDIDVLGTKNSQSSGTKVVVDAFMTP